MACKYQYNNQWYSKEELVNKLSQENSNFKTLYQNLVNEITNTETGRKVLDRIKRDYQFKKEIPYYTETISKGVGVYYNSQTKTGYEVSHSNGEKLQYFKNEQEVREYLKLNDKYTLEEQQEEAIVELLGLMTAEKLDKVKDGKLISLLKRLLLEIQNFIRNLLNSKEVYIENLPESNKQDLISSKLNEMLKSGKIRKEC